MTDITSAQAKMQSEESQYNSAVSEALINKIGANINWIYDNSTTRDELDAALVGIEDDIYTLEAYHAFNNTYFNMNNAGGGAGVINVASITIPAAGLYELTIGAADGATSDALCSFAATTSGSPTWDISYKVSLGVKERLLFKDNVDDDFSFELKATDFNVFAFDIAAAGINQLSITTELTKIGSGTILGSSVVVSNFAWNLKRL